MKNLVTLSLLLAFLTCQYSFSQSYQSGMNQQGQEVKPSVVNVSELPQGFNTIKYVCSAIQGSNFPISFKEQHAIAYEYYSLFAREPKMRIDQFVPNSSMFIGPSSYTLQQINLIEDPDNKNPCVLNNFCVTDKADGDRKLLYISNNGHIYFITMNMLVQYTKN